MLHSERRLLGAGRRFGVRVGGREVADAFGLHNARAAARGLVRDGYPEAAIVDARGRVVETAIQNDHGDVVLVPYDVELVA